jgi:hypothetical protein
MNKMKLHLFFFSVFIGGMSSVKPSGGGGGSGNGGGGGSGNGGGGGSGGSGGNSNNRGNSEKIPKGKRNRNNV